jgi:cell wall-associated NlpC family hydrolase
VALVIIFIGAAGSLAVPAGAHAAPAATTRTGSAVLRDRLDSDWFDSGRQRVADPIADQAAIALMLLRQAKQTMLSADVETYSVQRNLVAAAVADRLGLDGQAMKEAWATADVEHQEALLAGLTQLGVPYRRNTSKPGEGFDCSGLTTYAWGEAGFTLTRQSSAQIRQASPRTFETAQAGDLMQYPGHVMMWLGVERAILHASDPGHPIEVGDGPNRRNVRIGDPTG